MKQAKEEEKHPAEALLIYPHKRREKTDQYPLNTIPHNLDHFLRLGTDDCTPKIERTATKESPEKGRGIHHYKARLHLTNDQGNPLGLHFLLL